MFELDSVAGYLDLPVAAPEKLQHALAIDPNQVTGSVKSLVAVDLDKPLDRFTRCIQISIPNRRAANEEFASSIASLETSIFILNQNSGAPERTANRNRATFKTSQLFRTAKVAQGHSNGGFGRSV